MAATCSTTIRMSEDLKNDCSSILKSLGLTFNSFVNMAVSQLVIQRRVPFEIVAPTEDVPNAETHAALVEAEAKELGLIPDDSVSFSDVHEAMAWLDGDDSL